MNTDYNNPIYRRNVISYIELRRTVGILAMSMPLILVIGAYLIDGTGILQSISSYYHTSMEGVFVGILFVTGALLFSYKGHEKRDDYAGDLACIFAIGVALFPTDPEKLEECTAAAEKSLTGHLHVIFAALFFLILIYFCLFLFTKSDKAEKDITPRKRFRNSVYRTCGYTMSACVIIIVAYFYLLKCKVDWLDSVKPVFWLETLAIWAFGFSWLVKGETLWRDEK